MAKKPRKKIARSYDSIAEEYAKEEAEALRSLRSLRAFARRIPPGGRVLDLGCGGGQDSALFADAGFRVVGIDVSPNMIRYAKRHVRGPIFRVRDFLASRFRQSSFDAVWCNRVFQHIPIQEQRRFMDKVFQILKPGGVMYLSLKMGGAAEDTEVWKKDEVGAGFLVKTTSKKTFSRLMRSAGFRVVKKRSWDFRGWWEFVLQKPE